MTITTVSQFLLDNGSTYFLQGTYQQLLAAIKELEDKIDIRDVLDAAEKSQKEYV